MAQCLQVVLDMTHVEGQRQGENRDLLLMSLVWYLKFTPRNILWQCRAQWVLYVTQWEPKHWSQCLCPHPGPGHHIISQQPPYWWPCFYYAFYLPPPCVHAKSLQSCPTLCDLVDCSPPGSSVHGILQARILEWVAISSSRGSSWRRDWTHVSYVSCIGRWVLYHWATEEALICKQAPALSPFSTTTARPFHFTILCPSKYVKNPRDGVAQSWTQLKWLSSSKYVSMCTTGVCAFP